MRTAVLLLALAVGIPALQDEKPSPILSKKRKATEKHVAPTQSLPDAGTAAPAAGKKPESNQKRETEKKAQPDNQPKTPKEPETPPSSVTPTGESEIGVAVLYPSDWDGRKTASGEPVDSQALTCSHYKYPMGTRLRVTHIANGRTVIVRVNDRLGKVRDRIIGLSVRAGTELGISGLSQVKLEVVR